MDKTLIQFLDAKEATIESVGGKGTNLVRLKQAGFLVPDGFILTTEAYRLFCRANNLAPIIDEQISLLREDDPTSLAEASQHIRQAFSNGTIPEAVKRETFDAYRRLENSPVAVRSSATAEDLPNASFAGQQDTFLNVLGENALLEAVVNCFSSLWTGRAIGYRIRNEISHQDVSLAVIIQKMVQSEISGVLFTTNPLNGKHNEIVIDASFGLGEALVSGKVEPDHYVIDESKGTILSKTLGAKAISIQGLAGGGTVIQPENRAYNQALQDEQILELGRLGKHVADEFHFPQDIEWAWANGSFYILQSRQITTLFPVPQGVNSDPLEVFFSFAAVQGMLDPITPVGRDIFKLLFARCADLFGYNLTLETQRVLFEAGERLWIRFTPWYVTVSEGISSREPWDQSNREHSRR